MARALALILTALILTAAPAAAHDLPHELDIRVFVKPEGERVEMLVRVPLALLEGIGLPKRGAGYLDLARIDEPLAEAVPVLMRELPLMADGEPLAAESERVRISQPSEDAFSSFDEARAHVLGPPLPEDTNVFWNQGSLDVYLAHPAPEGDPVYVLDARVAPGLGDLLRMTVTYVPEGGEPVVYHVHGGHGLLALDPGIGEVAATFLRAGANRVAAGPELLLFLLCLVLPFRDRPSLAPVVGAYALAFAFALLAGAGGLLPGGDWLAPVLAALIALAITWLALENVVLGWLGDGDGRRLWWRWPLAGGFGLVLGLHFAQTLGAEMQLAGAHPGVAVLAFDLGLLLAQAAVLAVLLPLLGAVMPNSGAQRIGLVIGSALIAHTGWHWLLERGSELRYVRWPEVAAEGPLVLAALAVLLLVVGGGIGLARLQTRRAAERT